MRRAAVGLIAVIGLRAVRLASLRLPRVGRCALRLACIGCRSLWLAYIGRRALRLAAFRRLTLRGRTPMALHDFTACFLKTLALALWARFNMYVDRFVGALAFHRGNGAVERLAVSLVEQVDCLDHPLPRFVEGPGAHRYAEHVHAQLDAAVALVHGHV